MKIACFYVIIVTCYKISFMKINKKWTIGGVALLLIGAYIVYDIIFNKDKSARNNQLGSQSGGQSGSVTGTITGSIGGVVSGITNFLTTYNDYEVTTQKVGLNVREQPNASSKVITSLPSGSTIKAKASGTKGWMAVSRDGNKLLGYVSQNYLKAKAKTK